MSSILRHAVNQRTKKNCDCIAFSISFDNSRGRNVCEVPQSVADETWTQSLVATSINFIIFNPSHFYLCYFYQPGDWNKNDKLNAFFIRKFMQCREFRRNISFIALDGRQLLLSFFCITKSLIQYLFPEVANLDSTCLRVKLESKHFRHHFFRMSDTLLLSVSCCFLSSRCDAEDKLLINLCKYEQHLYN